MELGGIVNTFIYQGMNLKPWNWLGMVAHTCGLGRRWQGWGRSEPRL